MISASDRPQDLVRQGNAACRELVRLIERVLLIDEPLDEAARKTILDTVHSIKVWRRLVQDLTRGATQ
jgi:hypothetical protein